MQLRSLKNHTQTDRKISSELSSNFILFHFYSAPQNLWRIDRHRSLIYEYSRMGHLNERKIQFIYHKFRSHAIPSSFIKRAHLFRIYYTCARFIEIYTYSSVACTCLDSIQLNYVIHVTCTLSGFYRHTHIYIYIPFNPTITPTNRCATKRIIPRTLQSRLFHR